MNNYTTNNKISKCVYLFPKDVLKKRRKNWSEGKPSHAVILGHQKTFLQIIKKDIQAVHKMHDCYIHIITDLEDCSKDTSLFIKMQQLDRCEVHDFSILNDEMFINRMFTKRENKSVWLYFMAADRKDYDPATFYKIEHLTAVGRQFNIVVTFASTGINLKNNSLYCIVSNASYLILRDKKYNPSKAIVPIYENINPERQKVKPFTLSTFETGDVITLLNINPFPNEAFHIKDKQIINLNDLEMQYEGVSVDPVRNNDGSYDINYSFAFTINDVVSIERDGILYTTKNFRFNEKCPIRESPYQ